MNYEIPLLPQNPDLEDIRLTKAEINVLKYINKHESVSIEEAAGVSRKYKQDDAYVRLCSVYLVDSKYGKGPLKSISRGKVWLEFYRQDTKKVNRALILSIIAIAIAALSLIAQAIQLISQWI